LPGDILTLACDGLKDYVPENVTAQTIHIVKLNPQFIPFSATLIAKDTVSYKSEDNVTVVTIHVDEY
jgi:serine/threonine protein phosphatase PrpC